MKNILLFLLELYFDFLLPKQKFERVKKLHFYHVYDIILLFFFCSLYLVFLELNSFFGFLNPISRKLFLISIVFCLIYLSFSKSSYSWGFYAHKQINRLAVYSVPEPLYPFYRKHLIWISEHAVDADKRRHLLENEACKHYLDADKYECSAPLDTINIPWTKAVEIYSEDTLKAHGIAPWNVIFDYYRLVKAFREKNINSVLKISADLGHYIGDCHVPLHTTHNYNGQLTGQYGIHAFWESRLPELFADSYYLFIPKAQYIPYLFPEIFSAVSESFAAKDSVLDFEKILSAITPEEKKYSLEWRGQIQKLEYSYDFSQKYHQMLGDMVQRRIKSSAFLTASVWYTAWLEAGQPNMLINDNVGFTENDSIDFYYKTKEIIGRPEN